MSTHSRDSFKEINELLNIFAVFIFSANDLKKKKKKLLIFKIKY